MAEEEKPQRRRGPVPAGDDKFTILLPRELGDWGKQQPGGLSELVRRLLREAKGKQEKEG